jgi:hypothetical protein
MKHLKLFESWLSPSKEKEQHRIELLNFSEQNLAYLIDKGIRVSCYNSSFDEKETVSIYIDKIISDKKKYHWSDIKDDIIPFVYLLNEKYKVDNVSIRYYNHKDTKHNIKDIINDTVEISDNDYVSTIMISVNY